jgi:hypothetical protein
VVLVSAIAIVGGWVVLAAVGTGGEPTGVGAAAGRFRAALVHDGPPAPRDIEPYRGRGTWVDAFDFDPAYQDGGVPAIGPDAVDAMAAEGVRTVYLQAARTDERSPAMLTDPSLLAQFLIRAHHHDMAVVGWYLPEFADVVTDLRHLQAVRDFEVFGHRFDGVAVDIEWTGDVDDDAERSARLVDLSRRLREVSGDEALGAIVLPPVQIEVVNPDYWPGFPWRDLSGIYDVWLPMSYWTFRSVASGYGDGYAYNTESTERLRANLGDPEALVHGIGGIGDEASPDELARFVRSLADTESVGGSIYDWDTLSTEGREAMQRLFTTGPGADLGG